MASIPAKLRELVEKRAGNRCEYCQVSGDIVVYMVCDHIKPRNLDGPTNADNLALSCPYCNLYKNEAVDGIDPVSDMRVALFNPRQEMWKDHFEWSEDALFIIGKTPTGRATVIQLHVNSVKFIAARGQWVLFGFHPPDRMK